MQSRPAIRIRHGRALLTALVISIGALVAGATGASGGQCIGYVYDGTGNRTAMITAPLVPIWGTAVWGCLSWTSQ